MSSSTSDRKKRRRRKRKGHYHRGNHVSPKAGECRYRSGWELKYMEWLDGNPDVVSYSYEKVVIDYTSNKRTGKQRKYYPDFLVEYSDRKELVEIKPSKRLVQARVKKKLEAATAWCLAHGVLLKVMTEHGLKELGLL